MNKTTTITYSMLLLIIISSIAYSGAVINKFEGRDGGNKVVLIWSSISEINLDYYIIKRSMDQRDYTEIGKVEASGPKSYEFIDKRVFKLSGDNFTFYYKICPVDKNGSISEYGKIVTVKPNVSGIKHTWGSIKAMFR